MIVKCGKNYILEDKDEKLLEIIQDVENNNIVTIKFYNTGVMSNFVKQDTVVVIDINTYDNDVQEIVKTEQGNNKVAHSVLNSISIDSDNNKFTTTERVTFNKVNTNRYKTDEFTSIFEYNPIENTIEAEHAYMFGFDFLKRTISQDAVYALIDQFRDYFGQIDLNLIKPEDKHIHEFVVAPQTNILYFIDTTKGYMNKELLEIVRKVSDNLFIRINHKSIVFRFIKPHEDIDIFSVIEFPGRVREFDEFTNIEFIH